MIKSSCYPGIVTSLAISMALLAACESPQEQEARARAALDAQLSKLETCAGHYEAMLEASRVLDAAAEARDHAAFMAADTAFSKSSGIVLICLKDWDALAREALDKSGVSAEIRGRVFEQWKYEHWSRLGLNTEL